MPPDDVLLYELLHYARAQAIAAVREPAKAYIDDERKAHVYGLMDGKRSQADIVRATGIPQPTVSRFMLGFVAAGLAAPAGNFFASHKALFTLEELDIDSDTLPATNGTGGE